MREAVQRNWGTYRVIHEMPGMKVKILLVYPRRRSSEQRHFHRSEIWVYPDGSHRHIPARAWHQLVNDGDEILEMLEVQIGDCREEDIERR